MAEINPPFALQNRTDHGARGDRYALVPGLQPNTTDNLKSGIQAGSGVVLGGSGGSSNSDALSVLAQGSPNMTVRVRPGVAVIQGTENLWQGPYVVISDAEVTLTVPTADPTNPRKDIVVAKVQDAVYSGSTNAWSIALVQGTPAGSPVEPTMPANATKLAVVNVAAADTAISQGEIQDTRVGVAARGAFVSCLSTARPASLSQWAPAPIYERDTKKAYIHDGTAWKQILVDGAAFTPAIECTGGFTKASKPARIIKIESVFAQRTSNLSVGSGATVTVATLAAITGDGTTQVKISVVFQEFTASASESGPHTLNVLIREGSTVIGTLNRRIEDGSQTIQNGATSFVVFTPSAASHTYNFALSWGGGFTGTMTASSTAPAQIALEQFGA